MRTPVLALTLTLGLLVMPVSFGGSPMPGGAAEAATLSAAQPPQIDVDVDTDEGGAWYTSPVWLAIGAIALVLVVVLIAMAVRGGGGTTIIRE